MPINIADLSKEQRITCELIRTSESHTPHCCRFSRQKKDAKEQIVELNIVPISTRWYSQLFAAIYSFFSRNWKIITLEGTIDGTSGQHRYFVKVHDVASRLLFTPEETRNFTEETLKKALLRTKDALAKIDENADAFKVSHLPDPIKKAFKAASDVSKPIEFTLFVKEGSPPQYFNERPKEGTVYEMKLQGYYRDGVYSLYCPSQKIKKTKIGHHSEYLDIDQASHFCATCKKALIKFDRNVIENDFMNKPRTQRYAILPKSFSPCLRERGLGVWEQDSEGKYHYSAGENDHIPQPFTFYFNEKGQIVHLIAGANKANRTIIENSIAKPTPPNKIYRVEASILAHEGIYCIQYKKVEHFRHQGSIPDTFEARNAEYLLSLLHLEISHERGALIPDLTYKVMVQSYKTIGAGVRVQFTVRGFTHECIVPVDEATFIKEQQDAYKKQHPDATEFPLLLQCSSVPTHYFAGKSLHSYPVLKAKCIKPSHHWFDTIFVSPVFRFFGHTSEFYS